MKISIISFTKRGMALSLKLKEVLKEEREIALFTKHGASINKVSDYPGIIHITESLGQWTKGQFEANSALLFIGACAIAVRAIAPFVKDKLSDPPVLVMDEAGRFVIPVLSGHYGGANELAEEIAEALSATAVITTATDVNGLFAVDVFARKNNLAICGRSGIEKVSSAVLNGERVTVAVAEEYTGQVPKELTFVSYPTEGKVSVVISPFIENSERADLQLCPKAYVIGVGCKRGKSFKEIEKIINKQLERAGLRIEAVAALASIDRKKEEAGLLQYAKEYKLPFLTFSGELLSGTRGEFTSSSFVKEQVGVDNVCERSAMAACGEDGEIILPKYAENGITISIAKKKWSVAFDGT
ncbi:cobalt-precorrin 5A hydrolase [Anaerocolumna xylanovorans]|uniref:Cobalt-precorrin 5A acetaldehyde-lyase n=1 Tax=Anaerocolumna xylanovorans DSM 12503 TaxID=1121345 RepID=A0A1M7XYR5_9FIRM|nr:cobalt-precorrin 5A hydrolase [Anaerocolumna xylanovorans]SHO44214.1 cobalt-precorrin 5A acetaldehyde-lyase [Anaerocolumna xylanovorans DSM 12503]